MANFLRRKVIIMILHKFVAVLILQVLTSVFCISRKRKALSYLVELLIPCIFLCIELRIMKLQFNIYELLIYFGTYICAKLIVLCVVQILKVVAFNVTVELVQNTKKRKANAKIIERNFLVKSVLKFVLRFRNVKYGPALKLGVPAMVNKIHKDTRVKFDEKGFPIFKSYYTVVLARRNYKASREEHFRHASRILYKQAMRNKRLASRFTKKELQVFSHGKVPTKYTWHHHQDKGVLQLVEYDIHSKVSHIGGYSIWGEKH